MLKKKDGHQDIIENIMSNNNDISRRVIKGFGGSVTILFIKQLSDRVMLSNYIIKPIVEHITENRMKLDAFICANQTIFCDDCRIEVQEKEMLENILNGFTVILFDDKKEFLIVNIKKVEKKAIENPELSFTLRGPRDCFNENLDVNLSLVRYRVKDPNLKINMLEAGRRTKTRIAVIFIEDIANSNIVKKIQHRIKNIDTDGIIESGELQKCLLNNQISLFPQMGLIERSDMACGALLEGKVIVFTEGSGLALVAPKTFGEFLWSCEDNYDSQHVAVFAKILRITALIFSVNLTSIYVILSSFNTDMLPSEYIFTLAISRANVPFNAFTGALLLEIIVEILREALLRVPKQIGTAIGIVGAIIIGQAAISAGIFSPLLLILVSLSLMSSFVAPDYTIMNPFRILKFFMLALTAVFGLFGFAIGFCFIIINIISTNSFGVAYFTPFAPFNWYDFSRTFIYNKKFANKRPNFLETKDKIRSKK